MSDPALSFIVGAIMLSLALISIPVILRVAPGWAPVLIHVGAGLAAVASAVIVGGLTIENFAFWPAVSIIAFGAMANLFVFSAVYKSVSLRMLVLLDDPSERQSIETLITRIGRPTVEARIKLLREMGLVESTPNAYFQVTSAGRKTAERLSLVQRILGVHRGGLYADRHL